MIMKFMRRTVIVVAIGFALQGCAVFVSDEDDSHHRQHHEHWGHEHSSLQDSRTAERAGGKAMAMDRKGPDAKEQERESLAGRPGSFSG